MEVILDLISARNVLTFCVVALFGYFILSWIFRKSSKTLPPGPRNWSTLWKLLKATRDGTLPQLAEEFARKYGPITFVPTLGRPLVLLNTTEITRKILASDKYKFLSADRIQFAAYRLAGISGIDMLFCKYDAMYRKKRRLFHNFIGLYGDGVRAFDQVAWEEMERMFTEIDQTDGKDTDITQILARSLKIIIYILIMGERPEDPTTPDIFEEYDLAFNMLLKPDVDAILQYLLFVAKIPGKLKRAIAYLGEVKKKADQLVYYNSKITHESRKLRGITGLLLDFGQKPGYEWINSDEHCIALLTSIYLAGMIVTKKIQAELGRVIGSKQPSIKYKNNMPYTEAVILEMLRLIPPVPLSGYRVPSEDIEYEGMTIPKDSLILVNNLHFLHDEKVWEDPWTFKAERFLDSEGNLLPSDHPTRRNMIAFGVGARACPGDTFALSRVFLFVTSILQRYDLLPSVNENLEVAGLQRLVAKIQGIAWVIQPFKCRLIPRINDQL